MTDVLCLDANIYVKVVVEEDPPELTIAARRLIGRVEAGTIALVAPAFAWAEVGSTIRKKVRMGELTDALALQAWDKFRSYPITYLDTSEIRARSWEIAAHYNLPTLYDASFLACTEMAPAEEPGGREFWTADDTLLHQFGDRRPPYVRRLGE